ncbi:MAG: hypothetical protein ACLRNQ_13165 [Flavonifractor plautii]
MLLFLLTMALLGGLTAAAGLWSHSRLEEPPALADSTWRPLPVREESPEETTVERAPTGDGTTLTISPCPAAGPTASRRFTGRTSPPSSASGGARGTA